MEKKKYVTVGGYYTKADKERILKAMKEGYKVSIYVDCIGHTRAEMVEATCKEELEKEVNLKEIKIEGSTYYYI